MIAHGTITDMLTGAMTVDMSMACAATCEPDTGTIVDGQINMVQCMTPIPGYAMPATGGTSDSSSSWLLLKDSRMRSTKMLFVIMSALYYVS